MNGNTQQKDVEIFNLKQQLEESKQIIKNLQQKLAGFQNMEAEEHRNQAEQGLRERGGGS